MKPTVLYKEPIPAIHIEYAFLLLMLQFGIKPSHKRKSARRLKPTTKN